VANRVVPEMWIAKRQPPELREFLQIQYIPERAHLGYTEYTKWSLSMQEFVE